LPDLPAKDSGSKEANEKVPKKGLKTSKNKWYIVGGLGLVAVLVFFFVSRSKANGTATSSTGTTSSLDPSTQAALESALQGQAAAGASYQAATGPQGPAGPAGPQGNPGAAGSPSPVSTPAPAVSSKVPATGTASQTYTVKAGDTLAGLATKYGISVTQLAHANTYVAGEAPGKAAGTQLGTGAGLKTGQVLTIPHIANP
jgi:LysM repeat protein